MYAIHESYEYLLGTWSIKGFMLYMVDHQGWIYIVPTNLIMLLIYIKKLN